MARRGTTCLRMAIDPGEEESIREEGTENRAVPDEPEHTDVAEVVGTTDLPCGIGETEPPCGIMEDDLEHDGSGGASDEPQGY